MMRTRPFNKMMLLAVVLAGCVSLLVATGWAQEAEQAGPDPRLIEAMDATDFEYQVNDDQDVVVGYVRDNGRTHVVFVNSNTEEYGEVEMREVWCIVMKYESMDQVSKDLLVDLMTASFAMKFGKFTLFVNEDTGQANIVFIVTVPADMDSGALSDVIKYVGIFGDEKEAEIEAPDNPDLY